MTTRMANRNQNICLKNKWVTLWFIDVKLNAVSSVNTDWVWHLHFAHLISLKEPQPQV